MTEYWDIYDENRNFTGKTIKIPLVKNSLGWF